MDAATRSHEALGSARVRVCAWNITGAAQHAVTASKRSLDFTVRHCNVHAFTRMTHHRSHRLRSVDHDFSTMMRRIPGLHLEHMHAFAEQLSGKRCRFSLSRVTLVAITLELGGFDQDLLLLFLHEGGHRRAQRCITHA